MERWVQIAKRADFKQIAQQYNITPVLARLMVNRGVNEPEQIKRYLYGTPTDLYDPHQMKDIDKAAQMIEAEIKAGGKIAIASDFDVDGIFSSYILYLGFTKIGGQAKIYTPNRVTEGYGLNERIVREAYADGARMIVTCDNGIAAFEAITLAKSMGMKVIVTDHHDIPYEEAKDGTRTILVSEADAIVNPKQQECLYPFKKLCGAGVVYKLIQVVYEHQHVDEADLLNLIQYVAVATVADVMDLEDENRIFVKYGLKQLTHTDNLGLQAIIEATGLDASKIQTYHIGFVIGPCFNAAGRLDTVKIALDLLMSRQKMRADALAAELKAMNESRKEMTQNGVEQAIELIESTELKNDKILLILLQNCHESLAGIIAGRIKEKYHKPTIVFTEVEDAMIKGSARSIEAYNIFEGLMQGRYLMTRFGGHPMAAGMTLPKANLEKLRRLLNEHTTLTEDDFIPVVRIDVPMPIGYITEHFIDELELLEPFGKGNTKPVFAERFFKIMRAQVLGKNHNVLKMTVCDDNHTIMEAMYFGDIEDFDNYVIDIYGEAKLAKMYDGYGGDVELAMTYYPSINEFRGQKKIQIVVTGYCKIER